MIARKLDIVPLDLEHTQVPNSYFILLWITMGLSSLVFFEPAPYDGLFLAAIGCAMLFSYWSFPSYLILPLLMLSLFLSFNLVSMLNSSVTYTSAVQYALITAYLAGTWLCVTGLLDRQWRKVLHVLFSGYLLAAVIAAVIGILAYFRLLPFSELFLSFGRASSLFKDPNVFGPFLVPAALYMVFQYEIENRSVYRLLKLSIIFCISLGILLSFSRAAWGNFCLSLLIYLLFSFNISLKRRIFSITAAAVVIIPLTLYVIGHTEVNGLFNQRLGFQNYDANRFSVQLTALETAGDHPFGIGPGQSEEKFSYSTHSLYVRVVIENGVLGGFFFFTFVVITLLRSLQHTFHKVNPYAVIVTASLIGLLFNSFFIDTLHWRHLWVLLALPWVPLDGGARYENRPNHYKVL